MERQRIKFPYGRCEIEIEIPSENLMGVLKSIDPPGVNDQRAEVDRSLKEPIGTETMERMVRPGDKVALIISDKSRPVPNNVIVASLLDVLEKKKVARHLLIFATVLVALGIIYGVRHMGLQGVSTLVKPLLSLVDNRPTVIASALQPIVIWKKVPAAVPVPAQEAPYSQPLLAVLETTPDVGSVTIEMLPDKPATPPGEPQTVAALEPQTADPVEPKAVPNQVEAPPQAPSILLPFSLQLSSCRDVENAQKLLAELQEKDLEAYLVKVQLGGNLGTWWRVYTGQYETLADALSAKAALGLDAAIVKKTPFANLVGRFTSFEESRIEKERLKALGLSPYVLEDSGSAFRLFVGAYTRKNQAEQRAEELQSLGLKSQAVTR